MGDGPWPFYFTPLAAMLTCRPRPLPPPPHCAATGLQTFFGRAAALLGQADQVANIQKVRLPMGGMWLGRLGAGKGLLDWRASLASSGRDGAAGAFCCVSAAVLVLVCVNRR